MLETTFKIYELFRRDISVYEEPGKLLSEHWHEGQKLMSFNLLSESISGTRKPLSLSSSAFPTFKSLFRLFQVWACACVSRGED